ncbi:pentatricopeptide repeat-containing protein At5g48730, chloroplastic isoform X2 [Arachis ipaensis]|uniref:pentatricopeptide repeat-containing protein At5g48730, chloroplastic isoform X2 n=1 Tax=Arachis ipaensis TaxID=130454 RepID=UPI000A2AFCE4|nr:pentatricopeptide repeat-containing protein At5g48730, chloroplastic isoform X2 [Arachis ipaensis]XP_025627461.1 pentatricopeptide repeat-containing protein At5g48730, chloroplastic isoform X2 [Arachis hypogaea]
MLMASVTGIFSPFPPPTISCQLVSKPALALTQNKPDPKSNYSSSSSRKALSSSIKAATEGMDERTRRIAKEVERQKAQEARERKEIMNRKIASQKAVSVILRREATKAIIDSRRRKGPTNPKKLLPRTVLEALHERVTALRWESALKVFAFDKVHCLLSDMAIHSIKPNTVTYNTLIDAYGKAKRFSEMESTLMEMLADRDCQPDVWTMNSTLRTFGNIGQIETMERCYDKFQGAGIQPNVQTFNILLDSYGKAEDYKKMSAVMEYMQKYHYSWTIVTFNIAIDAFGKAGDLKQMEYLFRIMRSERIKPSCVTLCSLVQAYARAGKLEKIDGVLRFVENSDVLLDTIFFNCLVDAYGRLECFAEMRSVLEMMEKRGCKPDIITYRTMIKAYSFKGMHSHVKELRELITMVQRPPLKRKKPDF